MKKLSSKKKAKRDRTEANQNKSDQSGFQIFK